MRAKSGFTPVDVSFGAAPPSAGIVPNGHGNSDGNGFLLFIFVLFIFCLITGHWRRTAVTKFPESTICECPAPATTVASGLACEP